MSDRAGAHRSRGETIAIIAVAAALAAEVARLTLASAYADTRPQLAQSLAPHQPEVLVTSAMAEVGEAAAQGQVPPQTTMRTLRLLSRVAPLRSEPFLVQAALAQKSGDLARAERLLLEARRRSPRSAAARYLLADVWLGQGRIEDGLGEMGSLSRLLPGSDVQLAPALSQYAKSPGAGEELKRMLNANPQLKQPLLGALATDPDNLPLILELDAAAQSATRRSSEWHSILLNALIDRGDYERAYALWKRLAGYTGPRQLLFNGEFRAIDAPPPFNWKFKSGGAGVVEPGDGRMRVIYYGRENAILATQLLLLPPGAYRLSSGVSGTAAAGAIAWVLSCLPGKKPLVQLELSSPGPAQGWFVVPAAGCDAQMLELRGRVQEMPGDNDLLVGPVAVQRRGQ